jgi:hypothetical protein
MPTGAVNPVNQLKLFRNALNWRSVPMDEPKKRQINVFISERDVAFLFILTGSVRHPDMIKPKCK